ncbi:MAG: adenine deaminase [Tissierellales bacterium]|jgi:adenine deaminase|nr:adenine deaminase [Tissierellales bacterium]
MNKANNKKLIDVAMGRQIADLVIKNCKVVNVFTDEILEGNLAVSEGHFVGMGDYEGKKTIDAKGKFIVPGLIDSHVHIESSMGSPYQFARAVLPRGTTTIISDCHEIANVKGVDGIKYMIDSSENLPLEVYVMLPSCVPATKFETSGAKLEAEDLEELMANPRVLGLGELMNYQGVVFEDEGILNKLQLTERHHKIVDGHGPVIKENELNAYSLVGVRTDHECSNHREVLDRVRNGIYVAVREGSAAKNLLDLIGAITPQSERRFTFCTDDRHSKDILTEGHIDNNIRIAIKAGMPPITAIRMATLNTAECYGIRQLGAIAPGYQADFIMVDNLNDFNVLSTFKKGEHIDESWIENIDEDTTLLDTVSNSINIKEFKKEDLKIKVSGEKARVIKIKPRDLVTESVERDVDIDNQRNFIYDKETDILPIYVFERHHGTGNIGKGLIEGYGLKNGAIASTIGHDSHNLIVIGDSDEDVMLAIEEIKKIGGGLVVVKAGEVKGHLKLDIAGLMSSEPLESVSEKSEWLASFARENLHINEGVNAFMTLAFMALPVIPELKMTDRGLFDVINWKHVEV